MIFIVYQNVRVISTCRPLHCMHMIICVNWNRGRTLCWLKMDDPPCAWRHSVHKASVWHKHLVQKNEEKRMPHSTGNYTEEKKNSIPEYVYVSPNNVTSSLPKYQRKLEKENDITEKPLHTSGRHNVFSSCWF